MKQLKLAAVILLVMVTSALRAEDPKELNVQIISKSDQTFKVIYKAAEKSAVKINIYDWDQNLIFSDRIGTTAGFSKPYNFKNLPQGNYTFEIITNGITSREEVGHYPIAKRATVKAFVFPTKEAGKFQLMVMANQMAPVNISILDANNQVLHEETVDESQTFGKVYNLNHLSRNAARFVVMSGDFVLRDKHFTW